MKLIDGSIYTGEFENGFRHGIGELELKDKTFYSGSFKSNLFHGFGSIIY